MAMDKDNKDERAQAPKQRRAYIKPQVEAEEVFETLALSCAKANQFQCGGGGVKS